MNYVLMILVTEPWSKKYWSIFSSPSYGLNSKTDQALVLINNHLRMRKTEFRTMLIATRNHYLYQEKSWQCKIYRHLTNLHPVSTWHLWSLIWTKAENHNFIWHTVLGKYVSLKVINTWLPNMFMVWLWWEGTLKY